MAAKLKIDATKLKAAMEAETDTDIDVPEVEVFSTEELSTRDKNLYSSNKTTMLEQAIKEYKKENNLDFTGKTLKALNDHLVSISADDKDKVIKTLRDNLTKAETEAATAKEQAAKVIRSNKLHSFIPELNNGMSKQEAEAVLAANGWEFKEENGKLVPYRDGEIVKDAKMLNNIEAKDAVTKFFAEEKKWVGEANTGGDGAGKNGRGGKNSDQSAKPRYARASEVLKDFEAEHGQGSAMGTEHDYGAHLSKAMKDAEEAGTPLVMD